MLHAASAAAMAAESYLAARRLLARVFRFCAKQILKNWMKDSAESD